jgi:hypothetical protein
MVNNSLVLVQPPNNSFKPTPWRVGLTQALAIDGVSFDVWMHSKINQPNVLKSDIIKIFQ